MPTEDYPLDYADFEGIIAEGQYGVGAMPPTNPSPY